MNDQPSLLEIPDTAGELLGKIDDSKLEALAAEVGMDETALYRKMREIFDYVNAAFEGGVSSEGNARYIDFVDMGSDTDPRNYNPKTDPFYRLINRHNEDRYQSHDTYTLGKIDPATGQGEEIFSMPFNPSNHKVSVGWMREDDHRDMFKANQILSQPNLYLRKHLLESKFSKHRRQKKERRLGKKAISFGRVT